MAKQTINIGTSANKGDGDPLRVAFDKVNDNFDELYARDVGTDAENLGSNLAPSTNGGHDLGTPTQRWADLYVRDFINLNGSTIQVDADGNFVFSTQVIAQVRQQQDITGSIFANDSSLAFDAEHQTFYGKFDGDVTGSVFADDSTQLIDAVAGTIDASKLAGSLPRIDGSQLTGITINNMDPFTGDITGSVFADDSTLLVDSVAGKIVGPVEADVTGNLTGNVTGNVTGNLTGNAAGDHTGTFTGTTTGDVTGNITSAGTSTFTGTVEFTGATVNGLTISGDTQGSVFGDDSTLLVDGVNSKIPSANLQGALPAVAGDAITIDSVTIKQRINSLAVAMSVGLS